MSSNKVGRFTKNGEENTLSIHGILMDGLHRRLGCITVESFESITFAGIQRQTFRLHR